MTRPDRRDDGAAVLEFVVLSVLVLVPLLYLLLSIFRTQAGAFAVTQAAREAGRAYATSSDPATAGARARTAADLAFADQGVPVESTSLTWAAEGRGGGASCAGAGSAPPPLLPGRDVLVCVRARVRLPFADRGLLGALPGGISVSSRYVVAVDPLRAGP